ncbi:MAG TPA: cytochrome c family protein [Kiloniellales bacterium]|nr:cytochrome c family protein [Kiloniellales bacterium]
MSLEFNKIAAAVLMAGIIAMFSGFIARLLFHVEPLHENAYKIAGVGESTTTGGGTAQPAPEPILGLIASADAAKGKAIFKACTTCHTDDAGGANKIGPNLWGVVGRKVGSHAGFSYSPAMAGHGGDWTYTELSHFLTAPAKYIPGTKMTFAGLKKVQDRADVIAYLRTQADTQAPLPTQEEIDAEAKAAAPAQVTPEQHTEQTTGETTEPAAGGTTTSEPAAPETTTTEPAASGSTTEPAETQQAQAGTPDPALREAIAGADLAAGEKVAKQCFTCHSFEKGGPNKVGPNLYGVIGSSFGHLEGFNYSKAFQDARAAGRTWTYEELAGYLANPKAFLPGNKMTFVGLKKPDQLAAVIAYLRTFHDDPPPLN